MGSEGRKQTVKMAGAVVASLISQNPAPMMIPLFESAFAVGERSRVKGRVEREFKKRSGTLSPDAVGVALALAHDAIHSAKFSLGDAAMLGFDATLSTNAIARHLDGGLTDSEDKEARLAIRVWCDELFRDARKEGSATFEMVALCLRRLAEIEKVVAPTARTVDATALRAAVTRMSATRALADSTRSVPFRGEAASRCLQSVRWDWNAEASGHLRAIAALRRQDGFDQEAALAALESIDSSSDALCTWWSLRAVEASVALDTLRAWARVVGAGVPEDVLTSLDWLASEAKTPRFGFVLPITGSWGSGKSRLLDELTQSGLEQGVISLYLDVRDSIRGAIDNAVHSMLGVAVGSGADLRTICEHSDRVVIVIDDFDSVISKAPGVFDEFWQLVSAWSSLPIRWVVTCDEAGLPLLMRRAGNHFWTQYGGRAAERLGTGAVTGWFALDDHNDRTALGLSILIQSSSRDQVELQKLKDGVSAGYPLRRELNQPMTALLRLRDDLQTPLDQIHLNGLMSTYWRLFIESLGKTESTDSEGLDRLVRRIARVSLGIATSSDAGQTALPDGSRGESGPISDTDHLIPVLARRKVVVEAPNGVYVPAAEISALWGYLLCRELGVTETLGEVLPPWEDAATTLRLLHLDGRTEAARALRFLFVWAAQRSYAVSPAEDFAPWWDAIADPDFPREVIWEAVACLPAAIVVSLVTRTRQYSVTDDEIFWILRAARLTAWSARDAAVGLEFVARTFGHIDALGLSGYTALALYKVIDAFAWTSVSDSQKALTRLGALSSDRLSWAAADRVVGRLDFRRAATRRSWLTLLCKVVISTPEPDDITSVEASVLDEALPFWLACVRRSLRQSAADAGPAMLDELIEAEWFASSFLDSAKSRRVAQLAQREAHNAFGRTFDEAGDAFIQRALQLAQGGFDGVTLEAQALAAMYGVRHTTSTKGDLVVRVDPRLRVVVDALFSNENLPPRHRFRLEAIEFDGP
jgi:hypothetical protein